jgi:hypothetical protein
MLDIVKILKIYFLLYCPAAQKKQKQHQNEDNLMTIVYKKFLFQK